MWARLRSWLSGVFGRERLERELSEEIQSHLEMRAEHWQGQGLSPEEAARRARIEFGGMENHLEDCREARGLRLLDDLRSDLTFGLRQLRRAPTFTLAATATLAVAIGGNTAIFSLLDALLLKTLPVRSPHELRELQWSARPEFSIGYDGEARMNAAGEREATSFAYPVYTHLRDQAKSFSELFGFGHLGRMNVQTRGRAELAQGLGVSGNFFAGLGLDAERGRLLTPEDDRPGAPRVAVLGHGVWMRTFGGDEAALGQTITVNGEPTVVVGIAPPAFRGLSPGRTTDVFLPLAATESAKDLADSGRWSYRVMGRLRNGVPDETARVEAEALLRQAVLAHPPGGDRTLPRAPRVTLNAGAYGLDFLRRDFKKPVGLLMAVVATILLIACANIAGLTLTRAAARQREMRTRLALGASRGRLARQLATESVLLATIGGSIGTVVVLLMRNLLPAALARGADPVLLDMEPNLRLFGFSVALCLAAGLLCGLPPALRAARLGSLTALTRSTPSAVDRAARFWTGRLLVVVQIALSLVLLVGAGLFVRTLVNLRSQALGFSAENLLLFQMNATLNGFEGSRLNDFYEDAVGRASSLPGVRSASASRWGLLGGGWTTYDIQVPGREKAVSVGFHFVAPGYFETMGIPRLRGRDVTWRDREGAPPVVIVNQAVAQRFFGGDDPVGRSIGFASFPRVEVVGIVGDARFKALRDPAPPTVYVPYRQHRQDYGMTFAVRADGDPAALLASLRRELAALNPDVPLFQVRTQTEQIRLATRQERLFAHLVSAFAVLALALACFGIYGTLAYWVTLRTPEIGVRMALGAGRGHVIRTVLRESLAPTALGLAFGLGGALAATRFTEGLLFGLDPRDGGTIAAAALVLLVSAALAAWLPARRASRLDPMSALRCE